jgi:hypothetical protein
VQLTEVTPAELTGIIKNELGNTANLWLVVDTPVRFERRHVYAIYHEPTVPFFERDC